MTIAKAITAESQPLSNAARVLGAARFSDLASIRSAKRVRRCERQTARIEAYLQSALNRVDSPSKIVRLRPPSIAAAEDRRAIDSIKAAQDFLRGQCAACRLCKPQA